MYFLKSAKQTTGIATINSTQLKNFPVLIPPLPLQQKFARIVDKIEFMRQSQNQSKQQIGDLFSALMQKERRMFRRDTDRKKEQVGRQEKRKKMIRAYLGTKKEAGD